ncbi:MAG: hypothetical protein ACRC5R_03650 [Mycoplasmatales bacterium]
MLYLTWWILETIFNNHIFIFFIADIIIFILVVILFVKVTMQNNKIKNLMKKTIDTREVVNSIEEKITEQETNNIEESTEKIEFNDEKIEEDEISFLVSQLINEKPPKYDTSDVDTVATIDIHVDDILEEISENKNLGETIKDDKVEKTLDNLVYIKKCLVEKIKKYNEEVKTLEFIEDQEIKEAKKNEILKKLKTVKIELEEYHILEKEVLKMTKNK